MTMIYIFIFATIVMLVVAFGSLFLGRDPVTERLKSSNGSATVADAQSLRLLKENKRLDKLLEPFTQRLKESSNDDTNEKAERADTLKAAGYYSPRAGTILYAIRFTLAIIFSTATAAILILSGQELQPIVLTSIVIAVGALGYYLPLVIVSNRAKERKLQFSEGLPDALDLMLICLEAGLTFPAAMQYIAKEFRDVHPVIAEHFEIVNLEFRAGRRRADAMRNLSRRVDLHELTSVVNMVNQSEILGTSLTRAVRTAAYDIRRERMLKAEEKANALPAKMSLVLTACIFPVMFCIILIPILLRFIEAFPK